VLAGCGGGSSLSSALENPGTAGVEALRQGLRSALVKHDYKGQCELLTPALIDSRGGSIEACVSRLRTESGPYSQSLEDYVAGGQIELRGNQASYEAPPGSNMFAENEAPGGVSGTAAVFTAVYTEGAWRITGREE
jgi:hypothetical protein